MATLTVPLRRVLRRPDLSDPILAAMSAICGLLVLFAIIGRWLTRWSPTSIDPLHANAGPSAEHWFGTDYLGRDLYSRAAAGARLSLLGPTLVVAAATTLAILIALMCAWSGGWIDATLRRAMDVLFAFPSLLFALIAVSVFGVGLTAPVIALAIAYVPYLGRVLRTVAVREANLPYIEACSLAGVPTWRIWLRHLVPALLPYVRAQATIAFGYAIIDLAGISFIGLGVQPPTADWGVMVAEAREPLLNHQPLEALVAGALIVATVVAFNVLGERLARRTEAR
jgi:peptide/nickel transport system permease protein